MPEEKIVVLLGSPKDLLFAIKIQEFLKREKFSVGCIYNVASAHKTPEKLLNDMKEFEKGGDRIVYITVAGLSDALSGIVAGSSLFPVIACPPDSEEHGGVKVFSSTAMPKGVPVAFVTKPENAALAAVRIFALTNPPLREQLEKFKQKMTKAVYDGAQEVKRVTKKKDDNRLAV